MSQPLNIPAEIKNHPDFKKNQKKFFGLEVSDTQSEYNRNAVKFFGGETSQGKNVTANNTLENKFMKVQTNVQVDPHSETFQKNAAVFYNTDFETKSHGSVFDRNQAAFYGYEAQKKNDAKLLPN